MFTGIIESTGTILQKTPKKDGAIFSISPLKKTFLQGIKIGDSISVSGACQTVLELTKNAFTFYSAPATLTLTTFNSFNKGTLVNLEKALKMDGRLDGHLVYGHIETTAVVKSITKQSDAVILTINTPLSIMSFIVPQGSICINGISLTLYKVEPESFSISVIPLTYTETNLQTLKVGSLVNIETDPIVKNIYYILQKMSKEMTKEEKLKHTLEKNGFL